MRWRESWRADPVARRIADGHYNRQSIGAEQFVPPGRCIVLVIPDDAFWVTSWPFAEYVKHQWPGAWVCSAFRNQRPDLHRSSALVQEALRATRFYWSPPPQGIITFVDPDQTKRKRDPGRCFLKARTDDENPSSGFHVCGKAPGRYRPVCICDGTEPTTKGGLVALHMSASWIPEPISPIGAQTRLAL